jgi:hypothetical protein
MKARLVGLGLQPMSSTSAEFGKFIADLASPLEQPNEAPRRFFTPTLTGHQADRRR